MVAVKMVVVKKICANHLIDFFFNWWRNHLVIKLITLMFFSSESWQDYRSVQDNGLSTRQVTEKAFKISLID